METSGYDDCPEVTEEKLRKGSMVILGRGSGFLAEKGFIILPEKILGKALKLYGDNYKAAIEDLLDKELSKKLAV